MLQSRRIPTAHDVLVGLHAGHLHDAARRLEVTTWCAGDLAGFSADGSGPYDPPRKTLVARTVDREQGRIVEVVVDDGKLRTATLTRRDGSLVFDATDDAHSFSGTVTMTGTDWPFTGWTYALTMSDGSGSISGTAVLGEASLTTAKYFADPSGTKRVKLVDSLRVISQAEYEQGLASLVAH